jgi:hypothetical protein
MNEKDLFELELEALRPTPLPEEVRRRIGRALSAQEHGQSPRWPWRILALTALAAAACIALVLFLRHPLPPNVPVKVVQKPMPVPTSPATLAAYQRALRESPQAMSALLDADAAQNLNRGGEVHALILTDPDALR